MSSKSLDPKLVQLLFFSIKLSYKTPFILAPTIGVSATLYLTKYRMFLKNRLIGILLH